MPLTIKGEEYEKMIKSFKPVHNFVTVRESKPERHTTESGIELPMEDMNPSVLFGEIVGVGEGKEKPIPVKEGDRIAYPETDGRYITVNGEKLKLLDSTHIIGIVTE